MSAITGVERRSSWLGIVFASLCLVPWSAAAAQQSSSVPAFTALGGEDRARAEDCLTAAIAYEAGYEPTAGKEAVAEVILNRARSRSYPKTVCGVVFAGSTRRTGCQFTFTCDGSLRRRLPDRVMEAARAVARGALDGRNPSRAPGATHYHADYVFPYWAPTLVRVTKLGAHIFYRTGPRASVTVQDSYVPRGEPMIAALAPLAVTPPFPSVSEAPTLPAQAAGAAFAPWGLEVEIRPLQR